MSWAKIRRLSLIRSSLLALPRPKCAIKATRRASVSPEATEWGRKTYKSLEVNLVRKQIKMIWGALSGCGCKTSAPVACYFQFGRYSTAAVVRFLFNNKCKAGKIDHGDLWSRFINHSAKNNCSWYPVQGSAFEARRAHLLFLSLLSSVQKQAAQDHV